MLGKKGLSSSKGKKGDAHLKLLTLDLRHQGHVDPRRYSGILAWWEKRCETPDRIGEGIGLMDSC